MRITPYWGTSKNRFAELISKGKSQKLIPDVDFTVSVPVVVANILPRNTRVAITFNRPGFIRQQEGRYTRLNITVLDKLPIGNILPVYIPTVPFKIHEILNEINFALGLSLDPSEVENTRYSTVKTSYQLRTKDSLAWTGNYTFKVTNVKTYIPLGTVLVDTNLNGFKYPLTSKPGLIVSGTINRWGELLELISNENGIRPPLDDNEVGHSGPAVPVTGNVFNNTKITIQSLPTGHYKNNVDVNYHRITLTELVGDVGLITDDPITPQLLIDFINLRTGADLTLLDVEPIVIPVTDLVGLYDIQVNSLVNGIKYCGSRTVQMLFGLPMSVEKLHILMNHTLPSEGYLT